LEISSSAQSGLKRIHPFNIAAGPTTEPFLDFDAKNQLHKRGAVSINWNSLSQFSQFYLQTRE